MSSQAGQRAKFIKAHRKIAPGTGRKKRPQLGAEKRTKHSIVYIDNATENRHKGHSRAIL